MGHKQVPLAELEAGAGARAAGVGGWRRRSPGAMVIWESSDGRRRAAMPDWRPAASSSDGLSNRDVERLERRRPPRRAAIRRFQK